MATDLEKLVVQLEAKTNQYEKAMARAMAKTNDTARKIEARFNGLNFGKDAFVGFARGAVAGLLPVLTLAAAVRKAQDAMRDFGDVADNAAAAGLDPELYQSLAIQFQQVGVEVGQTASALATFAKNSGLAVEGKGKMVGALKALDAELLVNIQNARDQEERIRLVADALNNTVDPARKAAIATAAFGEAGLKMVAAFDGGSAKIDTMMVKARELGLIVDRQLIERADELGDKFDLTAKIVDVKLKKAFVDLGPIMIWLIDRAGDLASTLALAADGMRPLAQQSRETLEKTFEAGKKADDALGGMWNPFGTTDIFGMDEASQDKLLEELKKRAMDELRLKLSQPKAIPPMPLDDDPLPDVTPAIRGATAAVDEHKEAVEELNRTYEELGQVGLDALTGIINAMADGKIEASELGDVLTSVLAAVANIALPGSGQVVQAIGGLFGGKRAAGGPVSPGSAYLVGERGPELFAPRIAGSIVPNNRLGGRNGSGDGGEIVVHSTVQVVDGNLVPVMTEISGRVAGKTIKEYDRHIVRRINEKTARGTF